MALEIRRVSLEFERFGRYVKGDRPHPNLPKLAEQFEKIGNALSEATEARSGLGKARYAAIAQAFEEIARLIRESGEEER
ncbi:MAG: hypothetical protein E6J29_03005 [Chloroflexi bacterium]|nr:MAG: hypothetical protein E6J29_03005 [Chloroflexota bacterium]TMD54071.1 MAG: hypothetical protein E6I85_06850 [Chloroflexota bacterium]